MNTNAVNAISEFLREETDENRRLGVVIFDEVKLREEIQFNATSLKVDGFVAVSYTHLKKLYVHVHPLLCPSH